MTQSIKKTRFEQLSSKEWKNHLKSWKRSGISKAEYCRTKHISYHAFNYWKKRCEKSKPASPSPSSITLVKLDESKIVTSSFQQRPETSQSTIPTPIRFWVKDFCVEVDNNFSPTVLSQLVQTLRRI